MMNEYDLIVRQRLVGQEAERRWRRNEQFVEELAQHLSEQPGERRFRLHLPRLRGFRLRRPAPPCRRVRSSA